MIIGDLALGVGSGGYGVYSALLRESTKIYIGDAAGTRERALNRFEGSITNQIFQLTRTNAVFIDSPATTSATTYKFQIKADGINTAFVNRHANDTDSVTTGVRTASSITVWEIPE